jgi:hypothetical protein
MSHPAFPSLSYQPQVKAHPITTTREVLDLVDTSDTMGAVRDILIPTLQGLADGEGLGGGNDAGKKGEEILSCPHTDLSGMQNLELGAKTAGVLYIL